MIYEKIVAKKMSLQTLTQLRSYVWQQAAL